MRSGDLQIFKVRPSDSGVYQCVAHNAFLGVKRNATNTVTLRVSRAGQPSGGRRGKGRLMFVSEPKPSTTPIMGANETLECAANGPTPPNVTWSRLNGVLPRYRSVAVGGNLVIIR